MKLEVRAYNDKTQLEVLTEKGSYTLYNHAAWPNVPWKATRSEFVALRWAVAIIDGRGPESAAFVTPVLGLGF
jgi:hypothetical protein